MIQFKKRSGASKNNRKKETASNEHEEEEEETVIVKKDEGLKGFGKESEDGRHISKAVSTVYESRSGLLPQVSGESSATATNEMNTALDRDSRTILEKEKKEKNIDFAGKVTNASGTVAPLRAPAFLRASCRFDYQPDICKDYKETGFCGYGDNCKFLHDRSDYKSGWQLEREWDEKQNAKKRKLQDRLNEMSRAAGEEGEENEGEENLEVEESFEIEEDQEFPFACFICRDDFKDPVITQCGHHFCAECALKRNKTVSTKCAVCGKQTLGIVNKARKLIKFMESKGKSSTQRGGGGGGSDATTDPNASSSSGPSRKKGSWAVVDE